ncbi:FAD-dependent oxidoreductase [Actinokineospora iranica]|nr:FAD-dependent oxidoreductase [Actinokineospora iranica]
MDQIDHQATGGTMKRRSLFAAAGLVAATPVVTQLALPTTASAMAPVKPRSDEDRWQRCVALARDLLLIGPGNEDLKLEYLRVLIDEGLPKTTHPKRVLVVGAGITGLVSGMLLKRAGHDVTILEANASRIGGRIKTFRRGPEWAGKPDPFTDPAQFAEAGAMRIPDFHPLTMALIDKLGLKRRLFYNVDIKPGTGSPGKSLPPVEYRSFTGTVWKRGGSGEGFVAPEVANRTWINTNGERTRRADYSVAPQDINAGFGVSDEELKTTAGALLDKVLDPVRDYYSYVGADGQRVNKPVGEWIEGWAQVIYDLDGYSMSGYLSEYAGLGERAVDLIGTLENLTSRMPLAFMHSFLTRSLVDARARYWEIEGGTAMLPYAMLPEMERDIRMNERMIRMEYWDQERDTSALEHVSANGDKVWVETTTENGTDELCAGETVQKTRSFTADTAIVTIPFSALRHVQISPLMSYVKRRAIIELHYDSATKVLLEFNRRWWEFTEDQWREELNAIKPGLYDHYRKLDKTEATTVVGGGSVTDNPNRFTYFPSHPVPGSPGGVVLASYSWADDASKWDAMHDDERYAYALRGMQSVFGKRIEAFYTQKGQTQSWLRNRYAFGEAAVFTPRQLTELHLDIGTPEGPVHFAGEHTSLKHAWIEGSLESAVRVALEVNS